MTRVSLPSTLLLSAFVAVACSGDGKKGTGVPVEDVATPPERAAYNPNAPAMNPEQPEGNPDQPASSPSRAASNPNQPVSGGNLPYPVPTGEPEPGPGPGGGVIRCARECDGLEGQCAELCNGYCSPYDGQAIPCRDELEELLDCFITLCESGATSGDCQAAISAMQECAQSTQASGG